MKLIKENSPLLVDAKWIRESLGFSMSAIKTANSFYDFPCPVVKISNRYQWKLADIEKWVRMLPPAFDVDGKPNPSGPGLSGDTLGLYYSTLENSEDNQNYGTLDIDAKRVSET